MNRKGLDDLGRLVQSMAHVVLLFVDFRQVDHVGPFAVDLLAKDHLVDNQLAENVRTVFALDVVDQGLLVSL